MKKTLTILTLLNLFNCSTNYSSSEKMENTLLQIGKAAEKAKRYPYAINVYQEDLKLEPKNIELIEHLATNYSKVKQYTKASSICKAGINLDPENQHLKNLLINSYLAQNKPNEATYWIKKSLTETNTAALNALGVIFDSIESHKKAQKCYLKALKAAPNDKQSLNNYGLSLALSNKPQQGIEELLAASTLTDSKVSEANVNLIKKTFQHRKRASKKLQKILFKKRMTLSKKNYNILNRQWRNFCR